MDRGKIPQNFIDDLLARVDIVDIISPRLKLKRAGQNHMGLCPFHNEKSPSFSVNQNKQFYHCFGCGVGGNAIKFLMEYEHLDFVPAIEELSRIAGVDIPRETTPQDIQKNKQQRALYDLLKKASEFYYDSLKSDKNKSRAVNYLKGRGLTGQIAKQFQIGYAPEGWSNLLDHMKGEGVETSQLLSGGLVVENDKGKIYDRFRNRIQFPIRDARGRYIGFGGRVLSADEKPKYLNSPETPVFHKGKELYGLYEAKMANRQLNRALIVEGYMDVVALAQYGISYAMATLGTSTSQVHLDRLFKILSDVIFCFDGDNAGRKAAFRALEIAIPMLEDGRQIRFLFLPDGEDPDSLVQKEGKEAFELRIRNATPLIELIFQREKENVNFDSLDGKASYARSVIAWLSMLPNKSLIRSLAFKRLADITGLEEEQLRELEEQKPEPVLSEAPKAEEKIIETKYPDTQIDLSSALANRNHSTLTPALELTALIIRSPKLRKLLVFDELTLSSPQQDIQFLIQIVNLLNSRDKEFTNQQLACHWLRRQGLENSLKIIENSDYFWMPKPGSKINQEDWLSAQFKQKIQYLKNKSIKKELEHLKNRINNHTSDVTEEERKRFYELMNASKRYGAN